MRDFNHTLDILVKAYLNDTLKHNYCYACAVGNIIASCIGVTEIGNFFWKKDLQEIEPHWDSVFLTSNSHQFQRISPYCYEGEAKNQIDSTGYTWQELARIEKAFELAPKGSNNDDWMFNGLLAVLDVLADIHQVDLNEKKIYQDKFTEIFNQ